MDALLALVKDLMGKKGQYAYNQYEENITDLLKTCPDIANSPNPKFKEWTVNILMLTDIVTRLGPLDDRIKLIMGQQILYYVEIAIADLAWNGP